MSDSIYDWDEPCNCLQKLGYDSTMHWWKFFNELKNQYGKAFCKGDIEKQFIYKEAMEIVNSDGMQECTCKAQIINTS